MLDQQSSRDLHHLAMRAALAALVLEGAEQDAELCRERMFGAARRLRQGDDGDVTVPHRAAVGALKLLCRGCGACEGL